MKGQQKKEEIMFDHEAGALHFLHEKTFTSPNK
jgi:hypothetical protein